MSVEAFVTDGITVVHTTICEQKERRMAGAAKNARNSFAARCKGHTIGFCHVSIVGAVFHTATRPSEEKVGSISANNGHSRLFRYRYLC